jgi:cytosine/adenosine deaminase-related metal-dependent hydrolase
MRGLADELALPVISHVQETRLQLVTGALFNGTTIVAYLERIGFLKPATSLIHAVWLTPPRSRCWPQRRDRAAQPVEQPDARLGRARRCASCSTRGVDVSLGSDGSCSTLTTSMLNVVGSAAAVAKLRGRRAGALAERARGAARAARSPAAARSASAKRSAASASAPSPTWSPTVSTASPSRHATIRCASSSTPSAAPGSTCRWSPATSSSATPR